MTSLDFSFKNILMSESIVIYGYHIYLQINTSHKHYSERYGKLVQTRDVGSVNVDVPTTINAQQLVDEIVAQFSRTNDNFNEFKSRYTYYLIYTPGDQRADFLPGGQRPFSLEEYKKLSNKPYSKIKFAICTNVDHLCKSFSKDTYIFYFPKVQLEKPFPVGL